MPSLATVEIPVITSPRGNSNYGFGKGKAPITTTSGQRIYGDGPLPIKPSDQAPKKARIVSRSADDEGVNYTLAIGGVEINDVGVEEILDYVSALELEEFENREFEAERDVLRVLEAEKERERLLKLERIRERAKQKGVAVSESDTGVQGESESAEEAVGKHGRKRPTYTKFYMKNQPRRKGVLVTDDDDDDEDHPLLQSSAAETDTHPGSRPAIAPASRNKRRRRKRDKVTGELLPLDPISNDELPQQKRPRRRRHPITGELMPLGWRFDPNEPTKQPPAPKSSTSFRQLSIADEPGPKRQKLDTESEMSRSPSPAFLTKAQSAAQYTPQQSQTPTTIRRPAPAKASIIEIATSEDDSELEVVDMKTPKAKVPSKASLPDTGTARSAIQLSPEQDEPVLKLVPSARKPAAMTSGTTPAKTSIMNPSAPRAPYTENDLGTTESSEADDEDGDDYVVEAITDHRLSDPRTHPPGLPNKPIMLYKVKWARYDETTW
jgi:hypothetical protein